MSKYWFTTRKTGYGTRPISWEGWLATFALAFLVVGAAYMNGFFTGDVTVKGVFHFIFEVTCFSVAFIILFKSRTDGELRWRWPKEM